MPKLSSRWVIDGSGAELFAGTVSISEARISQVEHTSEAATRTSAAAVDLDGYTILPGLIDAHSHLGLVAEPIGSAVPVAILAAQIFDNASIALDEGFTTLRDLGGLDGGLVEAIRLGVLVGPRILPSGPIISQQGGHGDWRPAFDHGPWEVNLPGLVQPSVLVDGADQMRRAGRMALRDGATQLKVALSGGFASDCDQIDDLQFSSQELQAAVEVAHGHHTYVTAHAHHAEAVRLGLRAGVECFEHATFVDAETVQEVRRHQAMVVATLSIVERYQDPRVRAQLRPELAERAESAFPAMSSMVKMAIAAGVTVGAGSDQVGPQQTHRGRELSVRAHVTNPLEAICAATGGNARILRLHEETGTLRGGMRADLCVVEGDPIQEPELFEDPARVRLVVRGGTVCKNTLPAALAAQVSQEFTSKSA